MILMSDLEKPNLHELSHYGVQGMKWGVRKERESEPSTTKKPDYKKIALITGGTLLALAGIGTIVYFGKKKSILSSTALNSLRRGSNLDILRKLKESSDVDDIIVPKGSVIQRVSKVAEKGFIGDRTYASITKQDNRRYKILMKNTLHTSKLFNVKMSTLNELKAPSDKTQFELFKRLIETNDEFAKTFTNKFNPAFNPLADRNKTAENYYHNFITGLIDKSPRNETFISYIKASGYNAIFDTNDAGVYSTKPIMVLDPSQNLVIQSAKAIGIGEKFVNVLLAKETV